MEAEVRRIGTELAQHLAKAGRAPRSVIERRMMRAFIGDPDLRTALFRFVDVRPACANRAELVRHLEEYLDEARSSRRARQLAPVVRRRASRLPTAAVSALGVGHMARQFIAGAGIEQARPELRELWSRGICATVDLLGEATFTEAEGELYGSRCDEVLRVLTREAATWPERPLLEADSFGQLPRVNLSVKISALTPHLRANAPERASEGAGERLRAILRLARELGAHVHVDMESLDMREAVTKLLLNVLAEPEFVSGPSAGLVLQGYLADSEEQLDRILTWIDEHPREQPFVVRLVKGAYWDHEVVQSTQNGWGVPVFTDRRACDRHFELLTRRLLDAHAAGTRIRVAVASHNIRSLAHAVAYSDHLGLPVNALELQVLRGLGDDTAAAIAASGRRVRAYEPVGDLVAGMAYLVRRLLENTSNDSFLAAYAAGADLDKLLEAP